MVSKTNLHLYEKPTKCLDCGGKLEFNGQSDFNIHVICERCKARFYYDKELGRS
jgi:tRNA(Ile2) C34 agmatinyltransferase TiaS